MFHVPEKYRWKAHPFLPSDETFGNNGFFLIPHFRIADYYLCCMAGEGMGWEHISITVAEKNKKQKRNPTWEEMCFVKDLFWDEQDCVMQLHPPKSEWISTHNFCLHLWRPIGQEIPLPPSIMVGRKDLKHEELEKKSSGELIKIIADEKNNHEL